MRLRLMAALSCAAFLGTGVQAQETTASIVGVVHDMSGAVVPGASVIATEEGGLAVHAVTDGSGWYRFPALPPGVFALTAHLTGFVPARVENVELRLGQRLDVPITLEQAALSETIRVVADSPTIAVTQSARATSLGEEEIESLPNGRDFTDVVGQVAGANPEPDRFYGNISIDGSSGAENRFIIDGAESTDILSGISPRPLVTDFLDEVQVKSSGYTAEFGGSTGGVINAITKSGTNTWHGDAILYWEADWLDAANRPTLQLDPEDSGQAEYVTFPKDDYRGVEPGLTLSGPIVRDSLWLFAGYLPRFQPIRRTAPFADGTTGTLEQDWTTHNAAVTVTGQLSSSWRFRGSYNLGHVRQDGQLQNADGTSPADAAYDESLTRPGWSLSGSVDWMASATVYTSLRAAYALSDAYTSGVFEGDRVAWVTSSIGLAGVPPEYQQPGGFANTPNNFARDRERKGRLSLQWDSTFFFSAGGTHQLKAGVQLDRRSYDILVGHTGNNIVLFWDQAFAGQRGAFGYYQVVSNSVNPNRGFLIIGDASTSNVGLFVQDAWTLGGGLTLNLGLRSENEDLPSFSRDPAIAATAVSFGFGDKLAPRLGFAWDATGDGRTKLYGSWGVFYDIMKWRMPIGFGGEYFTPGWYTLDDPDVSQIQDNPLCPPDCPGELILELPFDPTPINDPDSSLIGIDPGLLPMKMQEAVIGIEREVASNLSLSLRYIHKRLDRTVEDVGYVNEDGLQAFVIANPGLGTTSSFLPGDEPPAVDLPRARRDYDAVELGLERRMAGGWGGRFFYLWSRLDGNESGLADSTLRGFSPNWNRTWDSPMMSFDENAQPVFGPLGTDRTHQLKVQLVYDSPFGTTVGASWFGASGLPLTRYTRVVPGERFPVYYRGRESDGRMPFASRLDLQVSQDIVLTERTRLTLMITAFNLFNQGTPTDAWMDELFRGQQIDITEAEFFQGFDAQELMEDQGLVTDPRFLMDRAFQIPRTLRLAVRFSF